MTVLAMYRSIATLIILISLTLLPCSVFSQPPVNKYVGDVVQPSPDDASLGKYLDIPISPYTGSISTVVPVHTLRQGPLSHSINLSAHSSGIRVEEMAGRVGLGWSLSAGGRISRSVNGLRDEHGTQGYYYRANDLDVLSSSEQTDLLEGRLDGEPDLFSFSFGSWSGHFYIDKNQIPTLVQKQDIKIEIDVTTGDFDGFVLVTPDGNRWYFGKYGSATAYDVTHLPGGADPYISSWHLLRVETYDGLHHFG